MRSLKNSLFLFLLLLLFLPLIQQVYKPFVLKPVQGYFRTSPMPGLHGITKASWLNSRFQDDQTNRIQDNIGLRTLLFRIWNQYEWSVFGKVSSKGFVKGKRGCLFQEEYILEYSGGLFIGKDAIRRKLIKLKDVQDSLKAHGIALIPVLEPGKASYFPENIPKRFLREGKKLSNYDLISQGFRNYGIRHIDLNRWFVLMKDTSRYQLFQPYGMHWSVYGEYLCLDTLLRGAEAASGIRMPHISFSSLRMSDSLFATDYDIGDHMNLLWNMPAIRLAYPGLKIDRAGADTSYQALVIADSYYKTIMDDVPWPLFPASEFWYYNSMLFPYIDKFNNPVMIDKSQLKEKLSKFKVILLMSSEINLHSFYWSFMDEVYEAYHPGFKEPKQYYIENECRNNYDWFFSIVSKARKLDRPLELQIRDDAAWMARQ